MSLKLLSLNIEYDKHLDRILPFLQRELPEVVCLQEVFLADIARIQEALGMGFVFCPSTQMLHLNKYKISPRGVGGLVVFSRLPITAGHILPYRGTLSELPVFYKPNDSTLAAVVVEVRKDNQPFTIATSHFTWSPDGQPSLEQRTDVIEFKKKLQRFPDLILTGDMNAPRGGEIFEQIGEGLIDAVPKDVTTTIDSDLHYSGGLELVVDVLFVSSHYKVESCSVTGGVSDHKAVVATISRVNEGLS